MNCKRIVILVGLSAIFLFVGKLLNQYSNLINKIYPEKDAFVKLYHSNSDFEILSTKEYYENFSNSGFYNKDLNYPKLFDGKILFTR